MSIEHANSPWGNFLRTIKGARGANIAVVGQPVEDLIQPTVQIEELSHLIPPTRWTQSAWNSNFAGVALENNLLEIRAVSAFWLGNVSVSATTQISVADAHVAATADLIPTAVFGEPPTIRFREDTAVLAPVVTLYEIKGTPVQNWMPARAFFIPKGKILQLRTGTIGAGNTLAVSVIEVPDPTTAP